MLAKLARLPSSSGISRLLRPWRRLRCWRDMRSIGGGGRCTLGGVGLGDVAKRGDEVLGPRIALHGHAVERFIQYGLYFRHHSACVACQEFGEGITRQIRDAPLPFPLAARHRVLEVMKSEHLEGDECQGVVVRARRHIIIAISIAVVLRGQVFLSTHNVADFGQPRLALLNADSEVTQHSRWQAAGVLAQQNIGGLDVPMHPPRVQLMVHIIQRRGNWFEVIHNLSHAKSPALVGPLTDSMPQGFAIDEGHDHHVISTWGGLLGIKLNYPWVAADLGERLHFIMETGAGSFITDIIQQHLDGELTGKVRIRGMKNLPHAAFTQQVHVGVALLLGQPLHEVGISHCPIGPYVLGSMMLPCPNAPKWRVLKRGSVQCCKAGYATCCSLLFSKDPMTTPGYGTNHHEHKTPTPVSGQPRQPQSEQRNLVPIICAIAILIALVIAGLVIWYDVRSTSQQTSSASETSEQTAPQEEAATPEETAAQEDEEADDTQAPSEQAPGTSVSAGAADVPEGLTAAGWSDFPEARCQQGEDMIFAAHGTDPDSHIVVCEKQDSLFYRGVWPSGAAFGPARGEGDSFSATILDPTSGKDTGSVLNIRGTDYDIDGEAGEFEDYWPR